MKRICVTGGAGMIGTHLVRALLERGHDPIVIDNLWRGRLRNLEEIAGFDIESRFLQLDLAEDERLPYARAALRDCDAVIHLADIVAGIGYVFDNQYDIFRINNRINTNVFRLCAEAGVQRILYAGTACSFPRGLQTGLTSVLREDQLFPAEPESAYGWSKLQGTLELGYLCDSTGAQGTTLMMHNVYGPYCDLDPATSQVIPSLIRRMMELPPGEPLVVWGSGQQGRAFVHVDDVAAAFIAALEVDGLPRVIQIGPDRCTSIRDLVELMAAEFLDRPMEIHYDTSRPEGDRGRCADYSLAAKVLGWQPTVDLATGLRDTWQWIAAELQVSV